MKAISVSLTLIVFSLFITGCAHRLDSAEELRSFVADHSNGLTEEKTFGELNIRLRYRPTDLLVDQELGDEVATASEVERLRDQYDDYLYFLLSYSANGKEVEAWRVNSQQEFSTRVQALAFGMAEQVKLSSNTRDSIPLVDFIYQRTFGGGSSSDILLAFDRQAAKDADWLNFRLQDIGLGVGTNHFRFDAAAIEALPSLPFVQP
ncbi:MAG: hypothetical protein AAGG75_23190 [Bacteroidota bacterium]